VIDAGLGRKGHGSPLVTVIGRGLEPSYHKMGLTLTMHIRKSSIEFPYLIPTLTLKSKRTQGKSKEQFLTYGTSTKMKVKSKRSM
jgi:hypothetical protein